MLHATMRAAIAGARSFAQMDELARQLWQGHGCGALTDDEAQGLAERLDGCRRALRDGVRPLPMPGSPAIPVRLFPPRRVPRSPDRLASRDRRRLLACSGPMPPQLAARFTEGQRAVLRIVADAVASAGLCDLCLDAIAARAGVCRRLAQSALRLAEGDGLLTIEERRQPGRRNATNHVRIVSREWLAWMSRGRGMTSPAQVPTPVRSGPRPQAMGGGCKGMRPTDSSLFNVGKTTPEVHEGKADKR